MKTLGIDLGTTSISCSVIDWDTTTQIVKKTISSNSEIITENKWEKTQNVSNIICLSLTTINECIKNIPDISAIGITGQMHGILYLDGECNAISDLVTWEDERGNLDYKNDMTYAEYISHTTGYVVATGYGVATHFYNLVNNLIPDNAKYICTIMDYLAIKLCNLNKPFTHSSNAMSLGLFDINNNSFDAVALNEIGIDKCFLPIVIEGEKMIGKTKTGIPVAIPIGDNQAGVLGIIENDNDCVLNIGTSSQISIMCEKPIEGFENRPFVNGKYIAIGPGLCGGSALKLLNRMICMICKEFSKEVGQDAVFDIMEKVAEKEISNENRIITNTQFRGNRQNPKNRGSINNISTDNFNPGQLVLSFYRGICDEMFEYYKQMPEDYKNGRIVLSGNVFRKNYMMRKIAAEVFNKNVSLYEHTEEAAVGASKLAYQQQV